MIDYTTTEAIMEEESESHKEDTDLFEDFTVEPSLVEGSSDEEFTEESAEDVNGEKKESAENVFGEKKDYVKLITEEDDDASDEADATEQREKRLCETYY